MSDETMLEEGQTSPSEGEKDLSTSKDSAAVVTKDIDTNRKDLKSLLQSSFDKHREPSPAKRVAAQKRERAEDGKFSPKEQETESKGEEDLAPTRKTSDRVQVPKQDLSSDTTEKVISSTQDAPPKVETTPSVQASTPALKAPTSWSAEAKATFDQLPAAVQSAVIKRETEVEKGFTDYRNRYQEIDRTFTPQRDAALQQLGKTRGQAVEQLFSWFDALANPATRLHAYQMLGQIHGITPQQNQPQSNQGPAQYVSPDQQQYAQALNPIVQELNQLRNSTHQMRQQWEQQTQSQVMSDIEKFAGTHPHFESVRYQMGQMMKAGMANDLESAYDMATRANKDVWSQIQADEHAAEAAKARQKAVEAEAKTKADAEAKRKAELDAAEKARKAGSASLRGGNPSSSSNNRNAPRPGESVKDTINRTRKELAASY